MGNASRKLGDIPDEQSGMTEQQMKLIKDTWHRFCDNNREYGVFLFLSLFIKHPEFLPMFPHFRGKAVSALKDEPMFRAHGCAIGYHITSLVDSLGDPAKFEVLARRNATDHLKRKGVRPYHFQVLGQCMVDVLQAKDERYMTPAAIEAWGKFLAYFVAISKDVFEQAAADRAEQSSMGSSRKKGSTGEAADRDSLSSHPSSAVGSTSSKKRSRPTSPTIKRDTDAAGGAKKDDGAKPHKRTDN